MFLVLRSWFYQPLYLIYLMRPFFTVFLVLPLTFEFCFVKPVVKRVLPKTFHELKIETIPKPIPSDFSSVTNAERYVRVLRYDFPRSHQSTTVADAGDAKEAPASAGAGASTKEGKRRHCYTNAAPGEMAPTAEIFTFNNNTLPPPPPPSTSSSASLVPPPSAQTVYSNLQSPLPVSSPVGVVSVVL